MMVFVKGITLSKLSELSFSFKLPTKKKYKKKITNIYYVNDSLTLNPDYVKIDIGIYILYIRFSQIIFY